MGSRRGKAEECLALLEVLGAVGCVGFWRIFQINLVQATLTVCAELKQAGLEGVQVVFFKGSGSPKGFSSFQVMDGWELSPPLLQDLRESCSCKEPKTDST